MLRTILPGFAKVRVTTKKSRLNSNTAEIEVVDITSLEVPKEIRVKKGERTNLQFTAKTFDGRFVEDIYALWETSNQKIARITRSGQIYGASEGTAIIRGGDDDTYSDPLTVIVEKNENEHDDPGEKSGGIDIRITNHDSQPESNKPYRPDGATKYPYIFQDEEFRDSGIWWINTDSPLALKIFKENPKQDRRRGSVVHPREARLYIAQCILEIVSRVEIKNEVDDLGLGDISTDEYHRRKNDFSVRFLEYLSENFEKFLK